MALHVGTSGWAYTEWRPAFYPAHLTPPDFLSYYASVLGACEINATHYRLPSTDTVARWAASVPADFRFAVKAHQRITAGTTIDLTGSARARLARFLDTVAGLGDRLGAVLLQYQEDCPRDDGALASALATLPGGVPFVVQFKHPSWDDPAVARLVADHGAALAIAETDGDVLEALPPGPLAYVRLRAERYDDAARHGWRAVLDTEARHRPVFAIARHQGIPAGNPHAGVGLAQWLSLPAMNK